MSLTNPWSKHQQAFWQEHAGNPRLALWHRVYALAYGVHRRNGHAPFKAGELALAVQIVDHATGAIVTPDRHQVSRAIATAVEYGFLASGSCTRCLVVPPYAIHGGVVGSEREKCDRHRHTDVVSQGQHRGRVVSLRDNTGVSEGQHAPALTSANARRL